MFISFNRGVRAEFLKFEFASLLFIYVDLSVSLVSKYSSLLVTAFAAHA